MDTTAMGRRTAYIMTPRLCLRYPSISEEQRFGLPRAKFAWFFLPPASAGVVSRSGGDHLTVLSKLPLSTSGVEREVELCQAP